MATIGDRVREARHDKDWTLKQLAIDSELSVGFICDVENGNRDISIRTVKALSDSLGVSVEYLVRGHEMKPMKCPMCKGSGKLHVNQTK